MLAPLAGYSDLPFRKVVKTFGVDITVSEMISSHALVYENKKTNLMTLKSPNEIPFALQIAGSKDSILQKAVEKINDFAWVDIIDFNCGCPAPKVANHGNGSALLKDLPRLTQILKNIRKAGIKKIYSVKVRLGYDKKIPLELADAINESGVDYAVVHARTKMDAYKKEKIDYDSVALMRERLHVPLIVNGEISSLESFNAVMSRTGAAGAMIGRAALKSPWIFWQIRNNTSALPFELKRDLVLSHLDSMFEFYGERGVVMFRKNLHAYAKGVPNASSYKDFVNTERNYHALRDSIITFFESNTLQPTDLTPIFNKKSV
ncbi:tRNA dihydrouridine synthase [Helicobacter saguini]|nr:tRNA-dihydrouridine synthase [Helicobacter saguini]